MKKLLVLLSLVITFSTFAGLTENCRQDIEQVADNYFFIVEGIELGEIRYDVGQSLLQMNENTAKVVAITCAGLKKISLERKLFISESKAEKIANETKKKATSYYNELISQGVER